MEGTYPPYLRKVSGERLTAARTAQQHDPLTALKAQRLDELHAWITETFTAPLGYRGMKDAAALLFFINTGQRPTDQQHHEEFEDFFSHLITARNAK